MTRSNYKVFTETYGDNEWVFSAHGGFSTYAAVVGLTGLLGCDEDTFDEICNVLEGLEDYPLIDEEAHSALEMEGADEAWKGGGDKDFVEALEVKFNGVADLELPADDALRTWFEEKREEANEYWHCEGSGHDMFVDIDRIVERIEFADVADFAVCYVVSYVDVGKEKEDYNTESEAIERVATLRADGFIGASYTVEKPVKE